MRLLKKILAIFIAAEFVINLLLVLSYLVEQNKEMLDVPIKESIAINSIFIGIISILLLLFLEILILLLKKINIKIHINYWILGVILSFLAFFGREYALLGITSEIPLYFTVGVLSVILTLVLQKIVVYIKRLKCK